MAFDLRHFQFARGVDSCYAQGSGVTLIAHSYKSSDDTISTIVAPGYFPPNIDGIPTDKIYADDQIMITGTDGTSLVNILTVDPITLSDNLFLSGEPGFSVGAPIAPVDAFGMTLSGDVLSLEYASATYPGIMSVADQTFSGEKTFVDHVHIGNGFEPAHGTGPTNLQILGNETIVGVNVQSSAGSIMQYSFGSPTIPTASYAGIEWNQGGFGPETPAPEVAIYNNGAIGMKVNTNRECIFPIGLKFGLGTNSLLNIFEEGVYISTFTNDLSISNTANFIYTKINGVVTLSLQNVITCPSQLAPNPDYVSNTALPASITPLFNKTAYFKTEGPNGKAGMVNISTAGVVSIFWDANSATQFPVSQTITFLPQSFTYSTI